MLWLQWLAGAALWKPAFVPVLLGYTGASLVYTLVLKRVPVADVVSPAMLLEAIHPDDRERVVRESRNLLGSHSSEDRYRIDYRTVAADGQVRWIVTRGRLLRDADGRPQRLIGTTLDTTSRKDREAATRATRRNAPSERWLADYLAWRGGR